MICMDINTRVRQRRIEMGLSQADLAQAVGVKQQNIQQLEDGTVSRPRYMHELANALNVDLGWLLTGQTQRAGDGSTASDTPEQAIAALLAVATPQGTKELVRLAELAQHGQLEDTDLKMLKLICERYKDR